jgi:hypothetical protein
LGFFISAIQSLEHENDYRMTERPFPIVEGSNLFELLAELTPPLTYKRLVHVSLFY